MIRALDQVVGQRENTLTSLQFQLRPSELIDLSAELAHGETEPFRETTPGGQVARRECGESLPLECVRRLIQDVNGATLYYEGEATASVGTLRGLLREMGSLTGRKILVLVTGGMIASDRPGVRPDVSDLGHQAGREAALANTAVYTLHIDVSALEHVSAQTAAADRSFDNIARDSVLLGGWLDQFSGEAGGTLFKVLAGSGEAAYDRILTETTAYYLLGVEVGDADRDGRTQEIQVKVKRRNLTVRGRKWVAIPKRGKDATGATPAEASSAPVIHIVAGVVGAATGNPDPAPAARVTSRHSQMPSSVAIGPGWSGALPRRRTWPTWSPASARQIVRGRTSRGAARCSRSRSGSLEFGATTVMHVTKGAGFSPSTTPWYVSLAPVTSSNARGSGPQAAGLEGRVTSQYRSGLHRSSASALPE